MTGKQMRGPERLTPGRAIRAHCIDCAGSLPAVRNCGGDLLCDGACIFMPYRMGRGAPISPAHSEILSLLYGWAPRLGSGLSEPDLRILALPHGEESGNESEAVRKTAAASSEMPHGIKMQH